MSLLVLFGVLFFLSTVCFGQSYRRFEFSSQTTTFRIEGQSVGCSGCPVSNWMIGPEFVFNLNRHFALDGALSWTPLPQNSGNSSGGRLTEVLIGPKASIRGRRFAFFTKARPGFVSWSRALSDFQFINFPPTSFADIKTTYGRRNFFAFALSGGIEYALSPRLTLTAEIGDTWVRHTSYSGYVRPITNNLQTSAGASYRFGKESFFELRSSHQDHKFFDRFNIALMTASLLSQTADAVTTQRRLKNCWRTYGGDASSICSNAEGNPIARPFVNQGWGGQVALAVVVNSAQTMVMYAIHRMGYHTVERVVPVPLTIEGGIQAYRNLQSR